MQSHSVSPGRRRRSGSDFPATTTAFRAGTRPALLSDRDTDVTVLLLPAGGAFEPGSRSRVTHYRRQPGLPLLSLADREGKGERHSQLPERRCRGEASTTDNRGAPLALTGRLGIDQASSAWPLIGGGGGVGSERPTGRASVPLRKIFDASTSQHRSLVDSALPHSTYLTPWSSESRCSSPPVKDRGQLLHQTHETPGHHRNPRSHRTRGGSPSRPSRLRLSLTTRPQNIPTPITTRGHTVANQSKPIPPAVTARITVRATRPTAGLIKSF